MGTKKNQREVHERHKLNNEVNHLKKDITLFREDLSIESLGKGFISNNEQTSRHDANVDALNLEGDANLNNHEVGKRKKKKKSKSGDDDADVETLKVREHDEVDMLEKNMREKVGKNGNGIDHVENEAKGKPKAKDGKKDEKKRKKQKRDKHIGDTEEISARIDRKEVGNGREILEEKFMEKVAKNGGGMDSNENGAGEGILIAKDGKKDEKMRKKRKRKSNGVISGGIDGKATRNERELLGENILKSVEPSRKKMKQRGELGNGEIRDHIAAANFSNKVEKKKKKKKKKRKKVESEKTSSEVNGFSGTEQELGDEVTDALIRSTSKRASKKVSFSEDVEIFPSSDDLSDEVQKGELVRGKRFSREEDEMVKQAVLNYIDKRGLGEEGVNMVLKCKKYPEVRNCWKEIGASLPWRPCESVYSRAHILFERDENRKWTEEECELVQKFYEKYGHDWRTLGDALDKHRLHVKDTWRRINLANRNRGQWSQDEYQSLFDLVNLDLRMKAFEERKSKHGMLRDNIAWTAIRNKLGTRATPTCCMKWYDSLTSPMVAEGKWLDVDDYRLLLALHDVDACCMEDVDWDSLLEHKIGDVCRKRWNQMVKHLGELQNGSFADQVGVLIKRYCPDVLESREAYNSKLAAD